MQKIPGSSKTIMIIYDHQIAKMDEIGKRFGISRSEVLRRLLETGLDSYEMYEKLGVVKLAEVAKRMRKAIEKDVQPSFNFSG